MQFFDFQILYSRVNIAAKCSMSAHNLNGFIDILKASYI